MTRKLMYPEPPLRYGELGSVTYRIPNKECSKQFPSLALLINHQETTSLGSLRNTAYNLQFRMEISLSRLPSFALGVLASQELEDN